MTTIPRTHLPWAVSKHVPTILKNPYFWSVVGAGALITGLALSSGPSEQEPSDDPLGSHCGFVRVDEGDGAIHVVDAAAANAGLTKGVSNQADALDALARLKGDEPLYPGDRYIMRFRGGEFVVGSLVSVPDAVNSCEEYLAMQNATPSPTPSASQS